MKRIAHIVEPSGQNKQCVKCFRDTFYLTRGHSRKALNSNKTVFRTKSHYIYTCVTCKQVERKPIYDNISYSSQKDYDIYNNVA